MLGKLRSRLTWPIKQAFIWKSEVGASGREGKCEPPILWNDYVQFVCAPCARNHLLMPFRGYSLLYVPALLALSAAVNQQQYTYMTSYRLNSNRHYNVCLLFLFLTFSTYQKVFRFLTHSILMVVTSLSILLGDYKRSDFCCCIYEPLPRSVGPTCIDMCVCDS